MSQDVSLEQVTAFERLRPQLKTLCEELKELSKKKADAALSKFKVKLINEKLGLANELLGDESKPFKEFDLLDMDVLPTTSDAVIVLSQYLESLETWRSARVFRDRGNSNWYWNIPDEKMWVETTRPRRSQVEVSSSEEESDEGEE